MAKLKKRADGRYQLKVTLPNGQYKFVYGRTQKDVQDKKADLLMQYGRGVTDFRSVTLEEWAKVWWETRKKGSTGFRDQQATKSYLNCHILPALGHLKIKDIRPLNIERFLSNADAKKAGDYSPSLFCLCLDRSKDSIILFSKGQQKIEKLLTLYNAGIII